MLTNSFSSQKIIYAADRPSSWFAAFFVVSDSSSRSCCFKGLQAYGQRNFTAMRDQHFQELMSKFGNRSLLDDGLGSVSENQDYHTVGAAKQSIEDQLDSQLAFKQFLKRNLPNRKPSSEFIQSIKDRIKIIDTTDRI